MSEGSNISAKLKNLMGLVNAALDAAFEKRDGITGAINWGDLSAVHAYFCVDDYATEWFQVIVSEAEPDSANLIGFIVEHVRNHGFVDPLVIETRW